MLRTSGADLPVYYNEPSYYRMYPCKELRGMTQTGLSWKVVLANNVLNICTYFGNHWHVAFIHRWFLKEGWLSVQRGRRGKVTGNLGELVGGLSRVLRFPMS